MAKNNEELNWFTVFRMDENDDWLFPELQAGRLRQGWGAPGCTLMTADGRRVDKTVFEEGYKEDFGEKPSSRRFAILTGMLDLNSGDVVVVPKMPVWNQFTIARVSEGYEFDTGSNLDDYRHIVHVDPGQCSYLRLPRRGRCVPHIWIICTGKSPCGDYILLQSRTAQGGPPTLGATE